MTIRPTVTAILNKPIYHQNITISKLATFSAISLAGGGLMTLITYLLTERAGLHYLVSMVVGGGFAMLFKFVLNAVITWRTNER